MKLEIIERTPESLICTINGELRSFYPFSPVARRPYREEGLAWYYPEGWQDDDGRLLILYWELGDSCEELPENWKAEGDPDCWDMYFDTDRIFN